MAESLRFQSILFEEVVWSVRVDAIAGTMAVQFRDGELRTAGYLMIRLEDGKWGPRIDLENGWWTELHSIAGNTLVIGRYDDPAIPVISSRVGVDGWKARILENEGLPMDQADGPILLPSPVFQGLELLEPSILPGTYLQSLSIHQYRIQAWHGAGPSGTELWLEIWDGPTTVLRTWLERSMEKLNPSPFFVAGPWLVTIRSRTELCWLRLLP